MKFFRGTTNLPGVLAHDSGTYIRFKTSQLPSLPAVDVDCQVRLPDGAMVAGRFHLNPKNPYIGGRPLIRWIKGWLAYGERADVIVQESAGRLQLRVVGPPSSTSTALRAKVTLASRALLRLPTAARRRVAYSRWERNRFVRRLVLGAYGPECQVEACTVQSVFPLSAHALIADVHHLDGVSVGGTDSPLNLAVLCVAHHVLVHRATSRLIELRLDGAVIEAFAGRLEIRRDARLLLAT